MKEKENILEILKLIPEEELKVMKFKSLVDGEVTLSLSNDKFYKIKSEGDNGVNLYTEYGHYKIKNGICVLFPIDMTWEELRDKYTPPTKSKPKFIIEGYLNGQTERMIGVDKLEPDIFRGKKLDHVEIEADIKSMEDIEQLSFFLIKLSHCFYESLSKNIFK